MSSALDSKDAGDNFASCSALIGIGCNLPSRSPTMKLYRDRDGIRWKFRLIAFAGARVGCSLPVPLENWFVAATGT